MDLSVYVDISTYLNDEFEKLFHVRENLISSMNKISFIDKEKYNIFSEELDDYIFDKDSYKKDVNIQSEIKDNIFFNIKTDRVNTLKKIFQIDQSTILKYITNGVDKKNISRNVKFEYLFENSIIRDIENKDSLKLVFEELSKNYLDMKNSLSNFVDGKLINQTDIHENDTLELFDKNNKLQKKMKQDFAFFTLFVNNGIVSNKRYSKFVSSYIEIFKKLLLVDVKTELEKETIKLWATGLRYLEILMIAYNISKKTIKQCELYKTQINTINPSLRFL